MMYVLTFQRSGNILYKHFCLTILVLILSSKYMLLFLCVFFVSFPNSSCSLRVFWTRSTHHTKKRKRANSLVIPGAKMLSIVLPHLSPRPKTAQKSLRRSTESSLYIIYCFQWVGENSIRQRLFKSLGFLDRTNSRRRLNGGAVNGATIANAISAHATDGFFVDSVGIGAWCEGWSVGSWRPAVERQIRKDSVSWAGLIQSPQHPHQHKKNEH